ncbi:DUF262 domain-containing protein [Salipiger thiooxidans]|uniref:DUF262 domain-containing protein n=1 Tax=Salipiger thiooxidans TaxID=282683 RepID=UPI001CD70480|nr:DUF262 domain-containing protein [Salipiger thiooxidans]MCA0851356.1 DUF262 domain-containing HNH endonuclease family protein [Salipiger thiooxidans]
MDVHKTPVLSVFDAKQRLEVPLFQRQYVWDEEHQWLPLWEDVSRKFTDVLEGHQNAPKHFLGAMVLDQKQTPTGHVVVRQVIDGQQRLTTLQIFLCAYRDFCRDQDCDDLAKECDKFIFNTGMMANPEVDKYKVWPTQLDRSQFQDIIDSGSRDEVLKRHPLRRRPYARKPEPRPRMIEAYLFFFERLKGYFIGSDEEQPVAGGSSMGERLDECFQALRSVLMVVVIDLEKDDDPQVIFETLNARGAPLLPADLLRNDIFFRANREGLDIEEAYKKYWSAFDDEFWRKEVKQGRLTRPRSDLFMQHFLASRQGRDIPIKHLFTEYRHWRQTEEPFSSVEEELRVLSEQGKDFRRILAPDADDVLYRLSKFLEAFDVRTAYPLLLAFMQTADDDELENVSDILESYLLRRASCDLETKNYNKVFLGLTRSLRRDGLTANNLRAKLLELTGDTSFWPDNSKMTEYWLHEPLYGPLNSPKLVYLLSRLNDTFMSAKSEALSIGGKITVEHIMPQSWVKNWLLPDGTEGVEWWQLNSLAEDDPKAEQVRRRNRAVQTIGNLTILTVSLNPSVSNKAWDEKRPELMKHSLLPINQNLANKESWSEVDIRERGQDLLNRALKIWTR